MYDAHGMKPPRNNHATSCTSLSYDAEVSVGLPDTGAPTLFIGLHVPGGERTREELQAVIEECTYPGDRVVVVDAELLDRPEAIEAIVARHLPRCPGVEVAFVYPKG